ncbi:MAG: hypothetical protein QOG67_4000 [Verrucomicrobiota bacterium]
MFSVLQGVSVKRHLPRLQFETLSAVYEIGRKVKQPARSMSKAFAEAGSLPANCTILNFLLFRILK